MGVLNTEQTKQFVFLIAKTCGLGTEIGIKPIDFLVIDLEMKSRIRSK